MRTENPEAELNALLSEAATPRAAFVEDLKKQVLSFNQKVQPQHNFLSYFGMKASQTVIRFGVAGLAVVVGVGIFGYEYWNNAKIYPNQDQLLAKISQTRQESNGRESSASTLVGVGDQAEKMALYMPTEDRDYTFRTQKTTYTIGMGAEKCPAAIGIDRNVATEEYAEYFATKSEPFAQYHKYVTYTKEGNIYDYSLTKKQEQWSYRGGSYAVHLVNMPDIRPLAMQEGASGTAALTRDKTADTVPSSDKALIAPAPVNSYFGENAKILGTETRNGQKVYKIQWSYETSCTPIDYERLSKENPDMSVSSPEMNDRLVVIAYADVKTYALLEENVYLKSVSDANLLYRTVREEKKQMIGETAEVKQQFTFDQAVTVKKVDASNEAYEQGYREALATYLGKRGGNVLLLKNASLISASSAEVEYVPDASKHYTDRAFYPNNEIGQKLWEDNKNMFAIYKDSGMTYPSLTLSYSLGTDGTGWLSLNEDVLSMTDSQMAGTFGAGMNDLKKSGTIQVSVSGQKVTATVYERIMDYVQTTEPGSTGSSGVEDSNAGADTQLSELPPDKQEPLSREVLVVFRYDGVTVAAMTSLDSKKGIATLESTFQFAAISSSNKSELLKQLKTAPVSTVLY